MSSQITQTEIRGLQPLRPGVRNANDEYQAIRGLLRRRLGERHARLFAEPALDPARARITWLTEAEGATRRFNGLDEGERQRLGAELDGLVGDITRLADELAISRAETARRHGELLKAALEIPDEQNVWVVGDQPILVAWGNIKAEHEPPRGVLARLVRGYRRGSAAETAAPAPAAPPGPVAPTPEPLAASPTTALQTVIRLERAPVWPAALLWLLFGLLVAAVLYLLLTACGVTLPGGQRFNPLGPLNACPVLVARAADDALAAEEARRAGLQDELARLERALVRADADCRSRMAAADPAPEPIREPVREAEPPPEPEPERAEVDEEMDRRLREAGGETGEVTVTLLWNSRSDLDLHVRCPTGETVGWRSRTRCGGRLDVDMNVGPTGLTTEPVENVVWPAGAAPHGRYEVLVDNFAARPPDGPAGTPFTVRVRIAERTMTAEGVARQGAPPLPVMTFDIP